jgi:hypothetical protein
MRICSLRSGLAAVGLAAAIGFSQEGLAMEAGDNLPMQQMSQILKEEGQHIAVAGNLARVDRNGHTLDGNPSEGAIVTMNDAGTLGYYIVGDKTIEQGFSEGYFSSYTH